MRGPRGLRVREVDEESAAWRGGIRAGDLVLSIDGRPVADELDFRFRTAGVVSVVELERQSERVRLLLDCRTTGDAGIVFEDLLADGTHVCNNRCVFCFIHQLPRGMRRSLYLRDDDFRLSFLYGHYVTLTNLTGDELERIVAQRLSPLYVSVHATDPGLRARMLGRRSDAPIVPLLRWFAERGVDVHAQVVLCPGLNDGDALERTVADLASLHPSLTGLRNGVLSVAVVPVGLTRYRERGPQLVAPDEAYARDLIRWHRHRSAGLLERLRTRFVWLSDEWFLIAGRHVPGRAHYEGFPQLEDGVGTTRVFLDSLRSLGRRLPSSAPTSREAVLVTGTLSAPIVRRLAETLNAVKGIRLEVLAIPNRFFGGTISVAGLLAGQDVIRELRSCPSPGDVLLPSIAFRDGDGRMVDDVTAQGIAEATGRRVRVVDPTPTAAAAELGLTRHRRLG